MTAERLYLVGYAAGGIAAVVAYQAGVLAALLLMVLVIGGMTVVGRRYTLVRKP